MKECRTRLHDLVAKTLVQFLIMTQIENSPVVVFNFTFDNVKNGTKC